MARGNLAGHGRSVGSGRVAFRALGACNPRGVVHLWNPYTSQMKNAPFPTPRKAGILGKTMGFLGFLLFLAVLAAIAAPAVLKYRRECQTRVVLENARRLADAASKYFTFTGGEDSEVALQVDKNGFVQGELAKYISTIDPDTKWPAVLRNHATFMFENEACDFDSEPDIQIVGYMSLEGKQVFPLESPDDKQGVK